MTSHKLNDGPPERIYLQCYDEYGDLRDVYNDDVTWCTERMDESDVAYVIDKPEQDVPTHRAISALPDAEGALDWK